MAHYRPLLSCLLLDACSFCFPATSYPKWELFSPGWPPKKFEESHATSSSSTPLNKNYAPLKYWTYSNTFSEVTTKQRAPQGIVTIITILGSVHPFISQWWRGRAGESSSLIWVLGFQRNLSIGDEDWSTAFYSSFGPIDLGVGVEFPFLLCRAGDRGGSVFRPRIKFQSSGVCF